MSLSKKVIRYDWGTPLYVESVELRHEILRKPLDLEFEISELKGEYDAMHYGLIDFCTYELIACLYVKPTGTKCRLKQMAVREKLWKKGFGKKLVEEVEVDLLLHGFEYIELHARNSAIGFYERLGYEKKGKIFTEIGIPHVKMTKNIKKT